MIQTWPSQPGRVFVGGYRQAMPVLGSGYIEPAALPDCPAAQVYRETLAGFLATRAASQLYRLVEHPVIIRSDCLGALSALRKGSFRSPALQDIAILHNTLLMDLGASPPAYLHIPGETMKAEGVDDLSRTTARARRDSESTAALRRIAAREAERLGAALSVDLFATAENAVVPRFFAQFPEPLAEGVDAQAQPDWGRSRCPCCRQWHRECVFAFPPRSLLPAFVAKARADGLRGVVVVPFTPSESTWPALEAASLTVIDGQKGPVCYRAELLRIRQGRFGSRRCAAPGGDGSRFQSVQSANVRRHRCPLSTASGPSPATIAMQPWRRRGPAPAG